MKKLPEKVDFEIKIKDEEDASGYLISLTVMMNSKNNYRFIVGPTNVEGKSSICRDEIVEKASREMELSLMDYHPIENAFSGEIMAEIMSLKDIKSAIRAYELYGPDNYDDGYIDNLNKALAKSTKTGRLDLNVKRK